MKKGLPGAMALALVIVVSTVVTGCSALTGQKPAGMTLEDAPEVLDLSSVLPSDFVKLDDWQALTQGVTKENLGLGVDASEPYAFRVDSPFQLVYCFLRIIEDAAEQDATARRLLNEDVVRDTALTFVDFVTTGLRLELPESRIVVSFPAVGVGAALAEGEIEFEDGTLRFDMLSFRSDDNRVFGFVHSWSLSDERVSAVGLGGEIERRITAFAE